MRETGGTCGKNHGRAGRRHKGRKRCFMDMYEFERKTTSLTVMNNSSGNIDIGIGHYGYENTQPDKDFVGAKGYPTFRLHYIIRGSIQLFVDGKKTAVKKEHCFLLRPDKDIGYKTNPQNPASFYWVSVSGQKCREFFADMGFTEGTHFLPVPKEARRVIHRAFFNNFNVEEPLKDVIGTVFIENFIKIFQQMYIAAHRGQTHTAETGVKRNGYIEQTLEYINRHYAEPDLTLRGIAHELHLHENYLSHIFSVAMGLPFREYLTQKRIETSCALMEQGYTSIGRIAEAVGFADALYFSKVFKRYNGIAPSEHLKKLQNNNTPPR